MISHSPHYDDYLQCLALCGDQKRIRTKHTAKSTFSHHLNGENKKNLLACGLKNLTSKEVRLSLELHNLFAFTSI